MGSFLEQSLIGRRAADDIGRGEKIGDDGEQIGAGSDDGGRSIKADAADGAGRHG